MAEDKPIKVIVQNNCRKEELVGFKRILEGNKIRIYRERVLEIFDGEESVGKIEPDKGNPEWIDIIVKI